MKRRSWQRHVPSGQAELNVIPLIDVVFFLLVFYVISTSFAQESSVTIDRPQSTQATAVEHAFVPVAIVKSGAIDLGSEIMGVDRLPSELRSAMTHAASTHVVIMADREVPTGVLLQVMDACRSGGATAVDVAAMAPGAHP
jgi:biopolymer transport protein ExbD